MTEPTPQEDAEFLKGLRDLVNEDPWIPEDASGMVE